MQWHCQWHRHSSLQLQPREWIVCSCSRYRFYDFIERVLKVRKKKSMSIEFYTLCMFPCASSIRRTLFLWCYSAAPVSFASSFSAPKAHIHWMRIMCSTAILQNISNRFSYVPWYPWTHQVVNRPMDFHSHPSISIWTLCKKRDSLIFRLNYWPG